MTGSNCMARMIAIRVPPPSPSNLSVRSWVVPSWPEIILSTARGSTVTGSVLPPP